MRQRRNYKRWYSLCVAATCLLCATLPAQSRREALTPAEIDLLRDAAQDADERLKLYLKFARTRLEALSSVHNDPKITDKSGETHDRLQDFLNVYDELNVNVDTFDNRKADLRKPLKSIVEADTEFQARLRALKSSLENEKENTSQYEFLLSNATATVESSSQDHRDLLKEQIETAKHRKNTKQQSAAER